ncbi:MAG: hypothetical protein IPI60_06015 [Saprospiraceae bacterium]|nr:hypothetical protein [Saprospiraceae bacterium]
MKKFSVENGKLMLISQENFIKSDQDLHKTLAEKTAQLKGKKQPSIFINGEPGDQYNYSLASCCNPLLGDDIFAFITTASQVLRYTGLPATMLPI